MLSQIQIITSRVIIVGRNVTWSETAEKRKEINKGTPMANKGEIQLKTPTISQTKVMIINKAMKRDIIRKRVLHVILVARRDTMRTSAQRKSPTRMKTHISPQHNENTLGC